MTQPRRNKRKLESARRAKLRVICATCKHATWNHSQIGDSKRCLVIKADGQVCDCKGSTK